MTIAAYAMYGVPAVLLFTLYLRAHSRRSRADWDAMQESIETGTTEPASLHPLIDPIKCIGCASCVSACPEQDHHPVIGIIRGKARLVGPSNCIGHGACLAACPVDAIELVFGSARRGVDIPRVDENFQTNVPGIFIAGELGGMGLIRNAIEQGRQALEAVRGLDGLKRSDRLDVIVVGAGPAGFSASLAAMAGKLRFVTLEQDTLGGTVAHFPRGKLVMTQPAELPIVGKVKFTETTKEALLSFWQKVETDTGLSINYNERVTDISPLADGQGFTVTTTKTSYDTRAVLLTIGRRGTPRQLGVPGEDQSKVVYRLIDPEQYRGQNVLVVGGGDSALEAAHSIAEEPGTTVTLSYRSAAFSRAKAKNRDKVEQLASAGRLQVLLGSTVELIEADSVVIAVGEQSQRIANDAVIVCAGGILPTGFLKEIGINVETKFGTR